LPSVTQHTNPAPNDDDADPVPRILHLLLTYPTPATDLTPHTSTPIHPQSWTSDLVERFLRALEATLKTADRETWGEALAEAYARAEEMVKEEMAELWKYAKEHPCEVAAEVVLTVLALGVLGRLVPGFLRVLGFGRLGPVEGEFFFFVLFLFSLPFLVVFLFFFFFLLDRWLRFLVWLTDCGRVVCGVVAAGVWRVCAQGVAVVVSAADGHDVGVRMGMVVRGVDEA
jgi:hypothetical protein